VEAYRRLQKTREELAGAHQLRDTETDDEMRQMAQAEIERLVADEATLLDELKVLLLPRDPADDGNVIVEIRAGAGGEEARSSPASCSACTSRMPDATSTRPRS